MLSPLVIVIEEDSNEESDVYCDWNGFHANLGWCRKPSSLTSGFDRQKLTSGN